MKTGDIARPVDIQFKSVGAIDDVLQHQIVNRGVGVFVFSADVEQVSARDAVGTVVEDVQAIAPPHQHQLAKLVGVLGKDVLRVAVGHRDGLTRGGKKIIFAKNELSSHTTTSTANNRTLLAFLQQKNGDCPRVTEATRLSPDEYRAATS